MLLTSELLTNAYLHARSPAVVSIQLLGETLQIEIADESDTVPEPRRPGDAAMGGRGLLLVEAVAHTWGVVEREVGKTVWFELFVKT